MGCNDFYDPVRERSDNRWRANLDLIKRSNCEQIRHKDSYVSCKECGAMIWTGRLQDEDELPMVIAHHKWHVQTRQTGDAARHSI